MTEKWKTVNEKEVRMEKIRKKIKFKYYKFLDWLCLEISSRLPRRLVLWCYINVMAVNPNGPTPDYEENYKRFKERYNFYQN